MLYFDNASTTKISDAALTTLINASEQYYNPSALYSPSVDVKRAIEDARAFFLSKFKGKPGSTFIFTGSATESNNSVLFSHINRKDKKYLFSAGEHSSIYESAKHYQNEGYNIKFIPLNKNGGIDVDALMKELDERVALVSVIHVSNETGAINDIKTITNRIKTFNKNIIVHSDGVQAVGKLDISLKDLGVDYYTISAHKIHGPKGIGALYIANPNKFKPMILGGGQEMGLRSGTENVPQILAFKTALNGIKINDYSKHKTAILDNIKTEHLLVSDTDCIDNIISICFKGVRGETIEHILEEQGFLIGTGSACNSKAGYNRVLENIVPRDYLSGAVRISFGADVTIEDCADLGRALTAAVKNYREKISR